MLEYCAPESEVGDEKEEEEKGALEQIIKTEMKLDRDIVDKAQNAFVSFVRYYKEHNLEFIFSLNTLDIGSVANSFFLFKMPRVREILGKQIKGFEADTSVVIEDIPYRDSNKSK